MKSQYRNILLLCLLLQGTNLSAQPNDTSILKLFAYRLGDTLASEWITIDTIVAHPNHTREYMGLPFKGPSGCSEGFRPERYTIHYSLNIPELDTLEKPRPLSVDVKNDCWYRRVIKMTEGESFNEYNKKRYETIVGYLPDCKTHPEFCDVIDKASIVQKADDIFGKKKWDITLRLRDAKFYWQLKAKKTFEYQDVKVTSMYFDANSGALADIYCKTVDGFKIKKSEETRELKIVKRNDGSRSRTMMHYFKLHFNLNVNSDIQLLGFRLSNCTYTFSEQEFYPLQQNKDYIFEVTQSFTHPKLHTGENEFLDFVRNWDYFYKRPIQELHTQIMLKKNDMIFILEPRVSYQPSWK